MSDAYVGGTMRGSLSLVVSAEFDAFVDPAAASSEAAQREGSKVLRARHQYLMLSSVFEKLAPFCLAGEETSEVSRCSRVAFSVFGRLGSGKQIDSENFRTNEIQKNVCVSDVRTIPRDANTHVSPNGSSPSERNS